jgi:hypothetical protein
VWSVECDARMAERPLMNDIPEMALRNIEDTFGIRFMRHRSNGSVALATIDPPEEDYTMVLI